MNLLQYLAHNKLAINGDKLSMLYSPAPNALQVVAGLIFLSHLEALRVSLCLSWNRAEWGLKKIEVKGYRIPKMAVNCQSLSKWFFLRQNIKMHKQKSPQNHNDWAQSHHSVNRAWNQKQGPMTTTLPELLLTPRYPWEDVAPNQANLSVSFSCHSDVLLLPSVSLSYNS